MVTFSRRSLRAGLRAARAGLLVLVFVLAVQLYTTKCRLPQLTTGQSTTITAIRASRDLCISIRLLWLRLMQYILIDTVPMRRAWPADRNT